MSTIFALATPASRSGVAIFRISGSLASDTLKQLGCINLLSPRVASLRRLTRHDNNEALDEALVLWFPAPQSFTGEDVAELHVHGSLAVIHDITQYLSSLPGLRLANPGEFSRRAFDNGRMDLTQIEGLADLIDAESSLQRKQALRQMDGELEKLYSRWREELITILALMEAYIDFPDEDIPLEITEQIKRDVESLLHSLTKHASDPRGKSLREGLYIAIIGAPNAGKSSLLNLLAKRDVAIVSDIAGTTRDTIEVHLDINGYPITLADTAGLRESDNVIEKEGVKRARQKAQHADCRLCIFDAETLESPPIDILNLVDDSSLVIINKSDRLSNSQIPTIEQLPSSKVPLLISATTGEGLDELLGAIGSLAEKYMHPGNDPVFTRERHRVALNNTSESLKQFLHNISTNSPIELCAEDLRHAAHTLGRITGRIDVEDLLDKIFSSFCIGK